MLLNWLSKHSLLLVRLREHSLLLIRLREHPLLLSRLMECSLLLNGLLKHGKHRWFWSHSTLPIVQLHHLSIIHVVHSFKICLIMLPIPIYFIRIPRIIIFSISVNSLSLKLPSIFLFSCSFSTIKRFFINTPPSLWTSLSSSHYNI